MSTSNNTIRPRGRGRGTFRPKYVTRSNLHVIATHVPAAPIAKKKPILKSTKKETNLVPANSKSPSKNSSVDQEIKTSSATDKESVILKTETSLLKSLSDTPKTDLVSVKETGVPKKDLVVQKKEEPQKSNSIINLTFSTDTTRKERQAFYALSNFVKLNELDKITPKRKSTKPKTFFTPKVLEIPPKTVVAPQNVKKAIKKDFVPSKKSVNQGLKTKPGDTKKATSHDSKTEPNQDKVPPYQKLNKDKKDSGFPSHPKADKPIGKKKELNKNATQQGKELSHPEEDSLGRQGGSKKARLDLSSNFEGHKRKSSFKDDGSNSREAYFLTEEDELASRKKLHSSRDYRSLEEEMYYKDKYKKSKKQDYKYKESESYDKYSWYSKDYKLKQKYEEEQYAFNEYSDYPGEEGDFEEVEDFEEVASVESKVPVYFRKCLVRYLPYKTFSYFRPKWYYISRKRYIVNCMYAAAKEGKITAEKERDTKENEENLIDENLHESGMEVSEEECLDNIEMIEVIPDDDILTEDISVHDEETISDDVSVHDEEIITDEVPAQDDSVEKDSSVSNKNDIKDATLNKEISTNNETVMSSDLKDSLKKDQNTENQTTPKKNLALEKENSIPVIDLSFESPEAKKVVNKPSSSVKTSDKGSLKNPEIVVKNMEVKVINLEEKDTLQEKSERSSEKDNEKNPSLVQSREFIKCNSSLPLNTDFNQGVAVIQSILADWKSHLIGLEYMLEIRTNVDEAVVKKYHCGLCGDDISVEKEVGQIVINHIISYKHMCNYMAKHFPSSDYKFSKSVRNYISEIVLQKCCEEINNKLGYNFMCIVKEDYFQNNGDKVKEHLNAMKHFSETDISIDPITTVSCLESDVQKDVVSLIDDVMKKIMIGEEKSSFFTPKTIVSNLRGSSVKDKKKELSKTIENTVSRNSQNALILLTPEHSQEVVSIQTTLADLKASEKMAPISKRLPRRSNLLQVPVHDSSSINLDSNKQPSVTTSSLTSVEINSPVKKVSPQKDLQMKKESNLEAAMSVDPNAGNEDSGTEFSAKNSASFSKLKPQESASTAVPKTAGSDNETVRIVRIKTVANRSLKFDEEEDDDTPVFLLDSNVSKNKESESGLADPELVNTDSINAGYSDTLQGEEISDNDFSDNDFVDVASTGTEAAAYKSKSRIKQHAHQKGPHSKFCRKRIYRGKESSTDQESALNDANISGNIIPTVDRFKGRHFSTFVKKSDELSLDSSISSSSRRKRSPLRLSRSPSLEEFLRKLSPSPKRSKSPLRLSRKVPYRKRGSPIRRHSRSPYRRYSRSPRKRHSRSPYRKRSRSPIRRRSRSPFRKRSRSPARKRSRSPVRRRSRSPYKKHSRSPRRRISRSPMRKRSRSPVWSASKGHGVHKSRSPYRKIGVRKISRSPERIPIKLPVHRVISKSPTRRSKSPSSSYPHSRSPLRSESRLSKDSLYKYKKESARSLGSFENPPQSSYPLRRKESEVGQELNDLDEVSDEDESKYFTTTSDNPVYMDIIKKLPESARIMLVKVLQRFSITNINPNDPSFFELMKFVASHSTEIQRLMSQPSVFSEVNAPTQATPVQSQESLVHQYLLSTMKGNLNPNMPRESFPSTSGMPSASADIRFQQPPMQSTIPGLQFLPPNSGLPPNQFQPSVFQQSSPQPQYSMQNIQQPTPPQVQPQQLYANSPAEQQLQIQPPTYQTPSPQKPAPAPKKKVKSEVMFKDLKATVNKIFGGDDVLGRIGIRIPGFNDAPDQEKWQPNAPTIPKVNPEPQTSFQGNRSEMNFHDTNEGPMKSSGNIPKNYSKVNEPYFEEMSRPEPYVPPPDAKVSFCDVQRSSQRNLFPVVNNSDTRLNYGGGNSQMSVNDAKKSLAQRLAAVLVKVGMTDVPAYLLQEMLMKIGAFSLNPPQDISEEEIIGILRKLKYL